jgi:hypothetical protein
MREEAMSTIPLTLFDGYLKQMNPSGWDQGSRSLFAYLFPAFTDERDVSVDPRSEELARMLSPFVELDTDVKQPRRFAGPYLPRARYFSVCRDGHGHDHDTLAHELRSYRDAARSGVVEVVDLGVRRLTLGVGDKEYDFDRRPEIGVFVHFPDRIPNEFATLVAQEFDDGHPVWMFRFPYSVSRVTIEDVVDLRLPPTQARFHEHFSRPRPDEGIMWPEPDTDTGPRRRVTTTPSTIAVSRFRSYEGRAPVPKDFYHMLPTLMNPHIGGGLASSTGSTVQAIGTWMRHNSVSALIYPSARTDAFAQVEDGELRSFGGWNLVDYRGVDQDPPIKWSYFDHSPWCWLTFPKGVKLTVALPDSETAGSFRFSGVIDYWDTDYLELVNSLQLVTAELDLAAGAAGKVADPFSYLDTWKIGIYTARWLRASTTKGTSEEEIRTAIQLLKGLAARRGLSFILGEIDEIAADLSEDGSLNKALRACVSLCGRVADRFEVQGRTDHEQLVTVAGNLELWMFYVSFGVRGQTPPQSGIDIARYRQLPLSERLRRLLSSYLSEVAAYISGTGGSREALLRKGGDLESRIASHLRSLDASAGARSRGTTKGKGRPEPVFVECASLMEEAEFVVRMTCPACGARVEHDRKESSEDPTRSRRMLDHFDITCNTCHLTWPLTVAIQY